MKKAVPGPGPGSVWDFPRAPQVEPCLRRLSVEFNGERLADTSRAYRVLETSYPPTYYIPQFDVKADLLRRDASRSFCEYKGEARYWDIHASARTSIAAARSYGSPNQLLSALRNHLAFHPHRFDCCFVDGERVEPQEGDLYGRWITSYIVGTVKGGPGTHGW